MARTFRSPTSEQLVFICPFCSKKLSLNETHIGKRGRCPQCGNYVRLFPNQSSDVRQKLDAVWFYTKPKLLVLTKDVGPISNQAFLELVDNNVIKSNSDIRSPELTSDEWYPLDDVNLSVARELAAQLAAETNRLQQIQQRREAAARENRERIRRLIRDAIADGDLTSRESASIDEFATRARISLEEVQAIVTSEGEQLLSQLIDDALEDGVLEPCEERQIASYSKNLGVPLRLTEQQERTMQLAKFAWELNHSVPGDLPRVNTNCTLGKDETCIARLEVEWHEIVSLKRPQGIPLGDGKYLKSFGAGICFATNKHLLFETAYESKKTRLSSVYQSTIHPDGIFLNRSTGKSLFLKFLRSDTESLRFGMVTSWLVAGVVQARFSDSDFVPHDLTECDTVLSNDVATYDFREPRFTFRVVGDFVGNRSQLIARLSIGEPLRLVREPNNPHDKNAVAVHNSAGTMLGYLKRDVADWFGPRMDSRRVVSSAEVHRIREDGALIVAVFE